MKVEVIALDHIYIAVRNLSASEAFYDPVMRFLDFRTRLACTTFAFGFDRARRSTRRLGVFAILGYPLRSPGRSRTTTHATFFEDPDGIRLEVVAEIERRRRIRDHWSQLTEFENPLAKAGLWHR